VPELEEFVNDISRDGGSMDEILEDCAVPPPGNTGEYDGEPTEAGRLLFEVDAERDTGNEVEM
jgi:hypothetical protein